MNKLALLAAVVTMALLASCGGAAAPKEADQGSVVADQFSGKGAASGIAVGEPVIAPSFAAPPISAPRVGGESSVASEQASTSGVLEQADRKVIATASVSLEVEAVQPAIASVRAIATDLGGFVEQLQSYGGAKQQQATVVVRVPEVQFFAALDRITVLGELQSQSVGSQDVTEQFIDIEARLKSSLRQEESLLALLNRAASVSEILTIERELARVRSEIERLQGQLSFLGRRVELATITVSLSQPVVFAEPPSASLTVEVPGVGASVDEVKDLVAKLKGTVDSVFLSVKEGRERAQVSVRVFTPDFSAALAAIEEEGKLLQKELREGRGPEEPALAKADEPDAPIIITFVEGEASRVLLYIIGAAVGALVLMGAVAGYQRLRRRSQARP
jgi:hypothetical protein